MLISPAACATWAAGLPKSKSQVTTMICAPCLSSDLPTVAPLGISDFVSCGDQLDLAAADPTGGVDFAISISKAVQAGTSYGERMPVSAMAPPMTIGPDACSARWAAD